MYSKFLGKFCALLIIAGLVACKNYSVSLNNNLVYTPLPLFKAFTIGDHHLHDCVEQTITDQRITKPEDLKQLNCSHAGIVSLAGLEIFPAIEQLNLSENALTTITQLSRLTQLKVLILQKNNLTTAEPLLHLLHLTELDISENSNISCGDVKQLFANFNKEDLRMTWPAHCKTNH
jgi:Leucine-rich repeat (LRR) protein